MRFTKLLLCLALVGVASPAYAYIEAPMTLGDVINQSNMITVLRVARVDKPNKLIVYEKVEDVKGKFPTTTCRHVISGQLKEGEIKTVLDWAEPGKTAIFFAKDGACETCFDNYWYQIYKNADDLYGMSHGEPFLLRSYAGKADKLPPLVRAIMEGREVVVPAMEDNKELLHKRSAKVMRMKASLKLLTYDPKRDFVGWGGEDIRRISGGTGFSQIGPLSRIDAEARSVSAVDFDGDGKLDVCIAATSAVRLFQNQSDSYSEVSLPGLKGGARSAAWGDHNGDGKPDLLLATADSTKLFTNLGGGQFRDDSAMLPHDVAGITSAVWVDADSDGKPDVLVATAFNGLRLYRNNRPADAALQLTPPKYSPWRVIGPFDNTGNRGFDAVYPPEKEVDFTKQYDGKGGKVAWKQHDFKDALINNLAIFGKPEWNTDVAVYVAREIETTGVTEIPISLGSDDGLAVFVNGERVLAENVQRAAAADQHKINIRLKPGKNTLVLKITQGTGDFGFYFSAGQPTVTAAGWFQDVSTVWGLGNSITSTLTDSLATGDVNNDGKPDFLYGTALYLNNGKGFVVKADAGLNIGAGTRPTLIDFDSDGMLDVCVPQQGAIKLFRNNGQGQFSDTTAKSGDLAKPITGATSATWGDFNNDGHLDVVVGCLRQLNRYYENNGDGTFTDQTASIGLTFKIFNTQALCLADLNNDGRLDLVMANEGQDSAILFGNKELPAKATPLVVHVPGDALGLGASVRITGNGVQRTQLISGGEATGQPNVAPRFVVPAGTYQVEIRNNGKTLTKDVTLTNEPMKLRFDEQPATPKK